MLIRSLLESTNKISENNKLPIKNNKEKLMKSSHLIEENRSLRKFIFLELLCIIRKEKIICEDINK